MKKIYLFSIIALLLSGATCKSPEPEVVTGVFQLTALRIGLVNLSLTEENKDVPINKSIIAEFNRKIDTSTVRKSFKLFNNNTEIPLSFSYLDELKTISAIPAEYLSYDSGYSISIKNTLQSSNGIIFAGTDAQFNTATGIITLDSIWFNGKKNPFNGIPQGINRNLTIKAFFSSEFNAATVTSQNIRILRGTSELPVLISVADNKKSFEISATSTLADIAKHTFKISPNLKGSAKENFSGFEKSFYTQFDSTFKFTEVTDDQLLQLIEQQTFKYFWDFGHPTSGLSRERNTSGNVVTSGGSGFGVMAIIIGIERGFITRQQGLERISLIVDFLGTADRFHGVWPHWLNGSSGAVIPFSPNDNGGDLVETSYLAAGLMCARQYMNTAVTEEKSISDKINTLLSQIEWSWYTRGGQDVLYWHWSPDLGWIMNMPVTGYNEALITYIMAATSATYPVSTDVYHKGWAKSGGIVNGKTFYGITLPLGYDYGGPLFFAHYSFLGINPTNLVDQYGNYREQNVNHTLINRKHCITNPYGYVGYSEACWGLTASDNQSGYSAHSPTNDLGVITPSAAISSIPYTPEYSMQAIRFFYYILGDKLWGNYGFYDAFNPTEGWWGNSYIAIDQGPIIIMIENYRTGLCWNLLMSAPEIKQALDNLGFSY